MKKRIFSVFALLTVAVTLLSALSITLVYYTFYRKNVEREIRYEASLISASLQQSSIDREALLSQMQSPEPRSSRLTLIDGNGVVLFDSAVAAQSLPNHADRSELIAAGTSGSGEALRYSDSLRAETYYYALLLDDGHILRVSRQMDSITQVFSDTIPLILLLTVFLLLLSLTAASLLTKAVIKPVNDTARELDDLLDLSVPLTTLIREPVYEELSPFIQKIRSLRSQMGRYLENLRKERDTLSAITQNMREGMILLDAETNILSVNNGAIQLLDSRQDHDYVGRSILRLTRDCKLQESLHAVYSTGRGLTFDVTSQSGLCRRYFISPVRSVGNESAIAGATVFIIDVTIEMRAERIRRDFAANVSHELKTPLTSINGFAEMLEAGMIHDPKAIMSSCARIHKESSRLISLIDDIMRLSEIENRSGTQREMESCSLLEIAQEALATAEQAAKAKQVSMGCGGDPILMNGVRSMLYELFLNLVENAVKYNRPGGHVEVLVCGSNGGAVITVSDDGIGIPQEHLDRIFERFYRVDKSRSKQTGGTGLGLSIVKHVVEYHHGSIEVESTEGSGTTMRATFPDI